jgi:hypothetical protein
MIYQSRKHLASITWSMQTISKVLHSLPTTSCPMLTVGGFVQDRLAASTCDDNNGAIATTTSKTAHSWIKQLHIIILLYLCITDKHASPHRITAHY